MGGDGSDLLARTAENVPDADVHFQLHQSDQRFCLSSGEGLKCPALLNEFPSRHFSGHARLRFALSEVAGEALKQTNITGTIAIGTIIIVTDTTSTTEDIGPIGTASRSSFPFKPRLDRRMEFTSVVLADFTLGRASHFLPARSGGTNCSINKF
jgi:hypothetical protein